MPPFFQSGFNKKAQRAGKGIDVPVDEQGHTRLHVSAATGDIANVAKLLQLGADPRQPDAQGQTPLYAAVATQNIALVKMLVDRGADFRTEDDAGLTPLLWAVEKNADVAFLEQLRELGAEFDFQSESGRGVLQAAAAANSPEVLYYLLKNKAPLDAADNDGKTALHSAIEHGAHEALRLLLARGADPLIRTKEIKTPLYLAAAKGDETAVDILLANPDVRRTLNDFRSHAEGYSPLMAAVAGNHRAIAEKLLDVGAHVNQTDHQNRHSLFIAAETGTPAMAALLIRHGADVEKAPRCIDRDQSMLHKINPFHYKELLLQLVAAGADLNAVDSIGQTPLYKAVDAQEAEKVRALLDLGANPDLPTTYGRRPIDSAVSSAYYYRSDASSYLITSLLLAAHANPNMAPSENIASAPLHVAARSGGKELVKLLLDHGVLVDEPDRTNGATPWLIAAGAYNLQACELLRERGADTAKKDKQLSSVLHYAAKSGAHTLLESGLKNPALQGQVNTPNAAGATPLHIATLGQKPECVRMLLAAGADVLAYDGGGLNALHHAARSYSDALFSIFDTTVSKKVDWNTPTRDDRETPLHLAARIGYTGIVEKLLKKDVNVSLQDCRGYTPLSAAIAAVQHGTMKQLIDHMKEKNISLDGPPDNAGLSPLHQTVTASRWAPGSMQLLLDAGADINVRMPEGDTPLHLAILTRRTEAVLLLARSGADVTLPNKAGATPLDLAIDSQRQDIIDALRQALREQQKKAAPVVPPSPPPNRPSAPKP